MRTLKKFELNHVAAGVNSVNHDHNGSKPEAGIKEDVISGLIVHGIMMLATALKDYFFNKNPQKNKDSENNKDNSSRFGFSIGSAF